MAKLIPTMTIKNSHISWRRCVFTPFRPGINIDFKYYPGNEWDSNAKCWLVPVDVVQFLPLIAEKHGFKINDMSNRPMTPPALLHLPKDLRDYQKKFIELAVHEKSRFNNFEMGLGKSRTAIEVMKFLDSSTTLIVCPANVKLTWGDEFKKWWPEKPLNILDTSKDVFHPGVNICSYEIFERKFEDLSHLDSLILDEAHYIKSGKSKRSKAVKELCEQFPRMIKLALTGTPICDQPIDLFHQLDTFWPGRFGNFFKFREAYCDKEENKYAGSGYTYFGINQERAEELRQRVEFVSSRVTRQQVAHLLPAYDVQLHKIRPKKRLNYKEFLAKVYDTMRDHTNKLDSSILENSDLKIKEAVEITLDAFTNVSHVCVLTHYVATAEKIAAGLQQSDAPVTLITGNVPTGTRHRKIAEARAASKSILVATMHCVVEGIDLTKFTEAIFAELYWQPKTMLQTLGRFSRLNSKEASRSRLLVLEGSLDEAIASTLMAKIKAQNSIIKAGSNEKHLQSALEIEMSDEEFLEQLKFASETRTVENEYY